MNRATVAKQEICNMIMSFTTEQLFDFFFVLENEDLVFPSLDYLSCTKCEKIYGDCNQCRETCLARFKQHMECQV